MFKKPLNSYPIWMGKIYQKSRLQNHFRSHYKNWHSWNIENWKTTIISAKSSQIISWECLVTEQLGLS